MSPARRLAVPLARGLGRLAIAGLILALAAPLLWVLLCSLLPESRLYGAPSLALDELGLRHYLALFETRDFWRPIRSSLIVASTTTVVCVSLGSLCAYALARLRFRGRTVLAGLILAVSMFPQIAIVSPLYLGLRELGLIDTYPGLILPYFTFAMPLTVWLLVGYFRQLPAELEDAAAVDGAGRLRTLWSVVLPLALPGLATTGILTFVYCWNEFVFALAFTTTPDRHTVPVAIALFRGRHQIPWGEVLAATVVSSLPVIVLVLAFQRRLVRGLTAGSVRG
jgi:ABC-type glycerol-3-phosphate transport system permease component